MKEKILYRQPVDDDLQAAFNISKESFSEPWSPESLKAAFKGENFCCMASEYAGELIGYAVAQTVLNEAEIVIVAVDRKYRNKGIAYSILECLERELIKKEITYCVLEVRVSNDSAIRLYSNFGFQNIGIRKDFYRHPMEDAYIMMKELGC